MMSCLALSAALIHSKFRWLSCSAEISPTVSDPFISTYPTHIPHTSSIIRASCIAFLYFTFSLISS